MIARRESSVRARISSAVAAGARAPILASSLASIAGHRPIDGREPFGARLGDRLGRPGRLGRGLDHLARLVADRLEEGAPGRLDRIGIGRPGGACKSSTKPALPPYKNEVSARTSFSRPASSAIASQPRTHLGLCRRVRAGPAYIVTPPDRRSDPILEHYDPFSTSSRVSPKAAGEGETRMPALPSRRSCPRRPLAAGDDRAGVAHPPSGGAVLPAMNPTLASWSLKI